jgi:protein SCO1/2
MSKNLVYQLTVGLLIGLVLVLAGTQLFNQPYIYQGSLIDPPVPAADFTLLSGEGARFRLNEQQGKIVLLYFGYTFCPDVCPTTLYDISKVKEKLGDQGEDVVFAMITVDPERDSLEKLGEYVTTFDPTFYGLTGDLETLEAVWADYGIFRQKNEVEGSAGYLVDHTARIYVISRQGKLRLTFPFGITWEAMVDDLNQLLEEQ